MPDTTQTLSTQITSAMTRIGQEFNAVRTEIATGGAPTSADKVTLADGKSVQEAIDDLNYVDPRITSFTNNVGTVEVGSTVTDITFNWKLNKTAKTLKFEGESLDVAATTKKLTGQTLTANKNFTLEMTDARDKKVSATTGVSFAYRAYWGTSTAATLDTAGVLGLASSTLTTSRACSITVTAGAGQYIYYAIPASFGTPKFVVGGFEGGFSKVATIDHTNASGATASYDIWRSDAVGLGDTTAVIS